MVQEERVRYPDDEARYQWLSMLLDAYHLDDSAIGEGLERERRKRTGTLACTKGCSHCCLNPTVPVTEIEIYGLIWYCRRRLEGQTKDVVTDQLLNSHTMRQCPFLVDGLCAVYPLRPIACRDFNVFGTQCEPYEDILSTRPDDIWSPGVDVARRVSMTLLPYYGITDDKRKRQAFETGFLGRMIVPLHTVNWRHLYAQVL